MTNRPFGQQRGKKRVAVTLLGGKQIQQRLIIEKKEYILTRELETILAVGLRRQAVRGQRPAKARADDRDHATEGGDRCSVQIPQAESMPRWCEPEQTSERNPKLLGGGTMTLT